MWMIETLLNLIDASALALIWAFCFGLLIRSTELTRPLRLLGGLTFGLGSWLAMLAPVEFTQGLMIDLRTAFIVLAAGFLGWQAGLIALAMTLFGRTVFFDLPPQGWALMAWVYAGHTAQYLTAVLWRRLRHHLPSNLPIQAAVLVVATQAAALALTNWEILLQLPDIAYIIQVQYGARGLGIFIAAVIMAREEALVQADVANRTQANRDPLTGLLNRRGLERKMQRLSGYGSLAVFCLDFDRFKALNDTYGHAAGDALLEAGARGFRHAFPVDGYLSRFGGDEFVGVAPDLPPERVHEVAQALIAAMNAVQSKSEDIARVTTSVGFSYGGPDDDLKSLIHLADASLYEAKAEGGNRARGEIPSLPEHKRNVA